MNDPRFSWRIFSPGPTAGDRWCDCSGGGLYLRVVPSANETDPRLRPPGALYDYGLCPDFPGMFEMVQLREFRMRGREVQGERFCPPA